jgi:chromosome segregation ATPase
MNDEALNGREVGLDAGPAAEETDATSTRAPLSVEELLRRIDELEALLRERRNESSNRITAVAPPTVEPAVSMKALSEWLEERSHRFDVFFEAVEAFRAGSLESDRQLRELLARSATASFPPAADTSSASGSRTATSWLQTVADAASPSAEAAELDRETLLRLLEEQRSLAEAQRQAHEIQRRTWEMSRRAHEEDLKRLRAELEQQRRTGGVESGEESHSNTTSAASQPLAPSEFVVPTLEDDGDQRAGSDAAAPLEETTAEQGVSPSGSNRELEELRDALAQRESLIERLEERVEELTKFAAQLEERLGEAETVSAPDIDQSLEADDRRGNDRPKEAEPIPIPPGEQTSSLVEVPSTPDPAWLQLPVRLVTLKQRLERMTALVMGEVHALEHDSQTVPPSDDPHAALQLIEEIQERLDQFAALRNFDSAAHAQADGTPPFEPPPTIETGALDKVPAQDHLELMEELNRTRQRLEAAETQASELFAALDAGSRSIYLELDAVRREAQEQKQNYERQIQTLRQRLDEVSQGTALPADLAEQLARLQQERDEAIAARDEVYAKTQSLFTQLDGDSQQLYMELAERLESLDQERQAHQRLTDELRATIAELRDRLERSEAEKAGGSPAIDQLQAELKRLREQNETLSSQLEIATAKAEDLFNSLDRPTQEVWLDLDTLRAEARAEREFFKGRIAELERKLAESSRASSVRAQAVDQDALERARATTETLRSQLETTRAELQAVRAELETTRAQLDTVLKESQAASTSADASISQELLDEFAAKLRATEEALAREVEDGRRRAEELERLGNTLSQRERELVELRDQLAAWQSTAPSVEEPLATPTSTPDPETVARLERLKQIESSLADFGGDPELLISETMRLQDLAMNYESQLKTLQGRIKQLESQTASATPLTPVPPVDAAELERLRNDLRVSREQLAAREASIEQLTSQLETLQGRLAELETASASESPASAEVEAMVAELNATLRQREASIEQLTSQLETLQSELTKARTRLEKLEAPEDGSGSGGRSREELKRQLSELEQVRTMLQGQVVQLSSELRERDEQIRQAEELIAAVEKDHQVKQEAIDALEAEVVRLSNLAQTADPEALKTVQTERDQLKQRLAEVEKALQEALETVEAAEAAAAEQDGAGGVSEEDWHATLAELERMRDYSSRLESRVADLELALERARREAEATTPQPEALVQLERDRQELVGEIDRLNRELQEARKGTQELARLRSIVARMAEREKLIEELQAREARLMAEAREERSALEDENRVLQAQLAEMEKELESLSELRSAVHELEQTRIRLVQVQDEARREIEQIRFAADQEIARYNEQLTELQTRLAEAEANRAQSNLDGGLTSLSYSGSTGLTSLTSTSTAANLSADISIDARIREFRRFLDETHEKEKARRPKTKRGLLSFFSGKK